MRDLKVSILSLATAALFLGTTATGQTLDSRDFQPRDDAGFTSIKRSFNATALSFLANFSCNSAGDNEACALTAAIFHKGKFWVLGREAWCCGYNGGTTNPIFEWTVDGVYQGGHDLDLPADNQTDLADGNRGNTAPEVRDMATDEFSGGDTVFIGSEEGIYLVRFDANARKWELTDTYVSDNGVQNVPNSVIRGEALAELRILSRSQAPMAGDLSQGNREGEGYMAVAYDPSGNGGDGSFWVGADEGSGTNGHIADPNTGDTVNVQDSRYNIYEIDSSGNILTTFINGGSLETDPTAEDFGYPVGGYWVCGGLEIDPITGNLWVLCEPENQDVIEVDITTGEPTGVQFPGFIATPGRQGGLVGIPQGDPGTYSSFWDLIAFTNVAGDDYFTIHRMHQYPGFHGLTEPRLVASTGNIELGSASPIPFTNQDTFNIKIDTAGRGSFAGTSRPDFPALLMFDFNDDTLSDAETDPGLGLGVIPELRVHSFLSNPPASAGALQASISTNQELNIDLSSLSVETGETKFRMQAMYFDPLSQYSPGLMVSNEVWASGVGINTVLVEADGDNSLNVFENGFFRVTWLDGPPIAKVKFDFGGTQSNDDLLNAYFDTGHVNQNDVMNRGRGIDAMGNLVDIVGCDGTYRNDSDLTTGLVFDMNNHPGGTTHTSAACDYWFTDQGMTYLTGYSGTLFSGNHNMADLEFTFTDFGLDNGNPLGAGETESFGFDSDTDGVVTRGGGHLGMAITVTLTDSTVLTGELLPDPEDRNRSFIAW